MKKSDFKDRFRYWFDNQMARGTSVMLAILALVMLVLVLVITIIIQAAGFEEEGGFFYTLWDVLSTTINAWMPASEDGGVGYILFTALSAIVGLFFTSFLIGIISSAVEDKLSQLRKGSSRVLEEDHIVILGFKKGEYTLLSQLILAAGSNPTAFLIAEDMDKEEMDDMISENIEVPSGIRIITRSIDISDPAALECCSLDTARYILVNPIDDKRSVKTLLAVNAVLKEHDAKVRIISAMTERDYMWPRSSREKQGILMLYINDIIARIMAHASEHPGLTEAFLDVFDFEKNEFYIENVPGSTGKTFRELGLSLDQAVPVGIYRDGQTKLNPAGDLVLEADDKLILFEEEEKSNKLLDNALTPAPEEMMMLISAATSVRLLTIGYNKKLDRIIPELSWKVSGLQLAGVENAKELIENFKSVRPYLNYSYTDADLNELEKLEELAANADQIIILSDFELDEDEADTKNIMLLLRLRDIRERLGLNFSITAEMRRDDNHKLVSDADTTDFIVSTNIAALVLAQVASNPLIYDTFHELLSNEGCEFHMKKADSIQCANKELRTVDIRSIASNRGFIFLGYVKNEAGERTICLNPGLEDTVTLAPSDELIVIEGA